MEQRKIYTLENKEDGVTIKCTVEYLVKWLSLGFEIIEIEISDDNTPYLNAPPDTNYI